MLLILIILMVITSIVLVAVKHNKRSVLLFATSISLLLFWLMILIYISKKGGIGKDMAILLFGTKALRVKMQYMQLTLSELGYLMAIGRYTFPPLLLWCAIEFSYFPLAEKISHKPWIIFIIPAIALILYYPPLFRLLFGNNELVLKIIVKLSLCWIFLYLILIVFVMGYEYYSITSQFFRRRFVSKSLLLFSMALLYGIYLPQDPAQVYMFYRSDFMWLLGLWYLSKAINTRVYVIIGLVAIVSGSVGFFSFLRYAQIQWDEEREEATLKKRGAMAKQGVGMFVHGIKNELIASKYILEDMEENMEDKALLAGYLSELEGLNSKLLDRTQSLYEAFKSADVHLQAHSISSVLECAIEKFKAKYPEGEVVVENPLFDTQILVDKARIAEAIYNLLTNGYEATLDAGRVAPIFINCNNERLWTSISVRDAGKGISKESAKRIWEPFYSTKNSSSSWGMGMYYTRSTIRSHLGSIRFETKVGIGTTFIILLPRYDRGRTRWEL